MRYFFTTVLFFSSASLAYGQTYMLKGQIINGTSLFTVNEPKFETEYDRFGYPEGGYPVDFEAKLVVDPNLGLQEFNFSATDDVETVYGGAVGDQLPNSGNTNNLLISDSHLSFEYMEHNGFFSRLVVDLDLETQSGIWTLNTFCPECDTVYALPSAYAEVTSMHVVPEPTYYAFAMVTLSSLLLCRRWRQKA